VRGISLAQQLVDRDTEHLYLLSIFQYAAAGVTALVGSFPLFHVAMGAMMFFLPDSMPSSGKDAFPREVGLFFMGIGLAFVTAGWTLATSHFLIARFLRQKRHFWFCVVASAISSFACMFSSGIVGIASLVILLRPGVRDLFEGQTIPRATEP
jgi:hypothetical protein